MDAATIASTEMGLIKAGVDITCQATDLLAMILLHPAPETVEIEKWAEQTKEEGLTPEVKTIGSVPAAKLGKFFDLTCENKITTPWIAWDHQNSKRITMPVNPEELKACSEYIDIYCNVKLDKEGNIIRNEEEWDTMQELAMGLREEYKQERNTAIANSPILNTDEAEKEFADIDTTLIEGLTLYEVSYLQELAVSSNIKNHMMMDNNGNYCLEISNEAMEAEENKEGMTAGEKLLSDYCIAVSVPQIKDYINLKDESHEKMAYLTGMAELQGNAPENTIVNLNGISALKHPERFDIHGSTVDYFMYGNNGEQEDRSYDLSNPKDYDAFQKKFLSVMSNYVVMETADYDSIYQDNNKELYIENIASKLKTINGYNKINEDVVQAAEALRENGKAALEASTDPENTGYRTIENRIPESDKVITATVAKLTDTEIDTEEMKHNLKINELNLKVTGASRHISTASHLKKDALELEIDARSYKRGYETYGELSPAEKTEYLESEIGEENDTVYVPGENDANHNNTPDTQETGSLFGNDFDEEGLFDSFVTHDNALDEPVQNREDREEDRESDRSGGFEEELGLEIGDRGLW